MAEFARLKRVGRLCELTGLSHTEIGQMDGERVEKLLCVMDTLSDWHAAKQGQENGE